MKKKVKYFKGFTLVEVLLVMGIFIILTVVGLNGFVTIRETFIAKENVELIIQDIESTRLKAMNMEVGKDATWIYGFGIDFTEARELEQVGDYKFFKWCSPVKEYGGTFSIASITIVESTKKVLPNLLTGGTLPGLDGLISSFYQCGDPNLQYLNGRIPTCYFNVCQTDKTGLIETNEISTLLDRGREQMEVLGNDNFDTGTLYPNYLFFESLTGRAIIYNLQGRAQSYKSDPNSGEVSFQRNDFVPLDIVLHRKKSDKFDLITVYPNSGEVIHHVYEKSDTVDGECTPGDTNIINYFQVNNLCYERFGIDDEIDSFRD